MTWFKKERHATEEEIKAEVDSKWTWIAEKIATLKRDWLPDEHWCGLLRANEELKLLEALKELKERVEELEKK